MTYKIYEVFARAFGARNILYIYIFFFQGKRADDTTALHGGPNRKCPGPLMPL